jgi:hypothetical protein
MKQGFHISSGPDISYIRYSVEVNQAFACARLPGRKDVDE